MHWHNSGSVGHPVGFIEPCLPTNARAVPTGPVWAYEIKHDGFRFICRRDGDQVRVFSRRGNDYSDRVPAIADALQSLKTLVPPEVLEPLATFPSLRPGRLPKAATIVGNDPKARP